MIEKTIADGVPGTCTLCGCSDDRPCLGGAVYGSTFEATRVHRLVQDAQVLELGATCCWIDESETVCSAHTRRELTDLVDRSLAAVSFGDDLEDAP